MTCPHPADQQSALGATCGQCGKDIPDPAQKALQELEAAAAVYGGLPLLVAAARATGASWAQIGTILGVSRQAAWERFHGQEEAPVRAQGAARIPDPADSKHPPEALEALQAQGARHPMITCHLCGTRPAHAEWCDARG